MPKLLPLVVIATTAALAACSSAPPQQPAPRIVTNVIPYTPGNGVVQAVYAAPAGQPITPPSSAEPMARLEIKMDNGKIQYVDTPSREFTRGSRVQLTEDRLIKRIG
jgi:hypothetical protein